jgi:hypothetical protein
MGLAAHDLHAKQARLDLYLFPYNGNFGTLLLVLGCFPFDYGPYQPFSDYSSHRFYGNLWFF